MFVMCLAIVLPISWFVLLLLLFVIPMRSWFSVQFQWCVIEEKKSRNSNVRNDDNNKAQKLLF